jgi:hypothetical protein
MGSGDTAKRVAEDTACRATESTRCGANLQRSMRAATSILQESQHGRMLPRGGLPVRVLFTAGSRQSCQRRMETMCCKESATRGNRARKDYPAAGQQTYAGNKTISGVLLFNWSVLGLRCNTQKTTCAANSNDRLQA